MRTQGTGAVEETGGSDHTHGDAEENLQYCAGRVDWCARTMWAEGDVVR